jgi:hypothetical protein
MISMHFSTKEWRVDDFKQLADGPRINDVQNVQKFLTYLKVGEPIPKHDRQQYLQKIGLWHSN